MRITVEREELAKSLARIQGTVEKRSTMPILNYVLIEAESNITLKATNLESSIIIVTAGTVAEAGKTCVPAKKLYEIVRNLPESSVSLNTEGRTLIIKSGKSLFKIFTQSIEDFPQIKIPQADSKLVFDKEHFLAALNKVFYSVFPDESRLSLNGVFMHREEDRLRFVASDGYRLAYYEFPFDKEVNDLLIPKKTVSEVMKMVSGAGEVAIIVADGSINIEVDNIQYISRLNDASFPRYKDVIPVNPLRAFIPREPFLNTLQRIATIADDKTKSIKLVLSSGKLTIKSTNIEIGEAEDELDITYDGESVEVGFNADYIAEAIKPLRSSDVDLSFKDSQTAITITGDEGYRALVMPTRI